MISNFFNCINFSIIKKQELVKLPINKKYKQLTYLFYKLNLIKFWIIQKNYLILYLNLKKIKKIKNLYKPSNFFYLKYLVLKKKYNFSTNYLLILSTNKGYMTAFEAVRLQIGGKLICIIY